MAEPVAGLEGVRRVLAVAAHPDDLDFGSGATLARLADAGVEVTELLVTAGDSGSSDPDMTCERLAAIRTEEARAAADTLGVGLVMLDHHDGHVVYDIDLRRDISREVRRHRPDVLMTLDPSPIIGGTFINHPDHRAVAQAALDSIITGASTRLIFPELLDEGLEPHKPTVVLLTRPRQTGNFFVDVTTTIERKIDALMCHASQVGHREGLGEVVRGWAADMGAESGYEFAESFWRIDVIN